MKGGFSRDTSASPSKAAKGQLVGRSCEVEGEISFVILAPAFQLKGLVTGMAVVVSTPADSPVLFGILPMPQLLSLHPRQELYMSLPTWLCAL